MNNMMPVQKERKESKHLLLHNQIKLMISVKERLRFLLDKINNENHTESIDEKIKNNSSETDNISLSSFLSIEYIESLGKLLMEMNDIISKIDDHLF